MLMHRTMHQDGHKVWQLFVKIIIALNLMLFICIQGVASDLGKRLCVKKHFRMRNIMKARYLLSCRMKAQAGNTLLVWCRKTLPANSIPVDPAGDYCYQDSAKPCEALSQDKPHCSVTRSQPALERGITLGN